MPLSNEQLATRQTGIGGSDIAAICGLSKWNSPLSVYLNKIGEGAPMPENERLYFGNLLEAPIAKEFAKRSGLKVQRINQTLRSPKYDFMLGNIDRALITPTSQQRIRVLNEPDEQGRIITTDSILEVKTADSHSAGDWGDSQEEEIKNGKVESEHQVPIYYETQVQWYLGLTGADVAYMAVLIGGNDFRMYQIRRDQEVIDFLVREAADFWNNHVLKRIPPEPVNATEAMSRVYGLPDGELIADDNLINLGREYRSLGERISALTKERDAVKFELVKAMAGRQKVTDAGGHSLVSRSDYQREYLDAAKVKELYPQIYKDCLKVTDISTIRTSKFLDKE